MKKILLFLLYTCAINQVDAQPVPKLVVAEHFTNTYCSICTSKNPGFYSNLKNFPQVLHVSYYPSAPYPACPLNQHNKSENDARTNFYGIYGSTPRLVIQGKEVTTAFTNPSIFQNELGQTSSFEVLTTLKDISSTAIEVKVIVRKKDASSLTNMRLYTIIQEDTLFFTAGNGETVHYDVFRKSVWGAQPISITAPTNVGDSVVQIQQITLNTAWNRGRVYAISILQDAGNNVIQASKSNHLPATSGIGSLAPNTGLIVYPNPTNSIITLAGIAKIDELVIFNDVGKMIQSRANIFDNKIDVSLLPEGMYNLYIKLGDEKFHARFMKN